MFQFRRFPTYPYFIQHTLPEVCSGGFPHSDTHGSRLICSSPWLFAAYRVLRRLLMPRHSPCALFRLTSSKRTSLIPFSSNDLIAGRKLHIASLLLLSGFDPLRWAQIRCLFFTQALSIFQYLQAVEKSISGFSSSLRIMQAPFRILFYS